MAFNNTGNPLWVNAGASVGWSYGFGDNRGAQIAMANPLTPNGQMIVTYEGDELNGDGTMTYFVGFQNNGPEPCFHNICGGGLS